MNTNKKILIVDDSEFDRNLMKSFLKRKGFGVATANNADECLEIVKTAKPHIILLDILMPNVHGKQLLHLLRKDFNQIELPIIMTTVKSNPSDIIESLALGANDYITKPIDFEIALMRVNTQLKITELNEELMGLNEVALINAMVATYNHEINNPLSVAIGALKEFSDLKQTKNYERLEDALWTISEIVKKIGQITKSEPLKYQSYSKGSKTIKLK